MGGVTRQSLVFFQVTAGAETHSERQKEDREDQKTLNTSQMFVHLHPVKREQEEGETNTP